MSAIPIVPGQALFNTFQQTGQVTKKQVLDELDMNMDGKISGASELEQAQAYLGESAAEEVIKNVNSDSVSEDTNLIEDAYGAADFDPVYLNLFQTENPLGIPQD